LEDKTVYQKNSRYWDNIISSMLMAENHTIEPYINTTDGCGNEMMDGNPIYHFKESQLNKCVRIVQEEGTNKTILFSAWIKEVELDENERADELVIALELTMETTLPAVDLIKAWILRDLTKYRMKKYIQSVQQLRSLINELQV